MKYLIILLYFNNTQPSCMRSNLPGNDGITENASSLKKKVAFKRAYAFYLLADKIYLFIWNACLILV